VGGRDEIDVVATQVLKPEHDLRQILHSDLFPFPKLGNCEILAKDAA
jgi:hypothetical protein